MKKEADRLNRKYVLLGIIALLLVLSYFIIKPYLISLISAFILAYLSKPIFDLLKNKIGKTLSAIVCVLIIIIIVILPLTILAQRIVQEGTTLLNSQSISTIIEKLSSNKVIQPIADKISSNINTLAEKGAEIVLSLFTSALSYIPSIFITILITLLGMFYALVKWDSLTSYLKDYVPFSNRDKTITKISHATKAIVYGAFLIAIIEFIVSAIAFYFIGVKYYLFLASLVFFSSFIPGIGAGIVWIPLTIYYLATGNYLSATLVALLGSLVISLLIDNLLRGRIIEKETEINPLIMILGVLGGVSLFGLFGFIIGPLILAYTIRILHEVASNR